MAAPPSPSISEPDLLPDVRMLVAWHPELAQYPERLADELEAEEPGVMSCLEALRDEKGEVLA